MVREGNEQNVCQVSDKMNGCVYYRFTMKKQQQYTSGAQFLENETITKYRSMCEQRGSVKDKTILEKKEIQLNHLYGSQELYNERLMDTKVLQEHQDVCLTNTSR